MYAQPPPPAQPLFQPLGVGGVVPLVQPAVGGFGQWSVAPQPVGVVGGFNQPPPPFGGGFGQHQFQLQPPTTIKKVIDTPPPQSWHEPIDLNEFLRLESELEEEKKKWTDINNQTPHTDVRSNSTTVGSVCSSSTVVATSTPTSPSTSSPSTSTPSVMELDLVRICEFRRLVVRLAASNGSTMCFTPEMIQCISNLIDDIVQYIFTASSTTASSNGQTLTTHQIHFGHGFADAPLFSSINDQMSQIRANYSQTPNDPDNWCRSTRVTKNLVERWYQRFQIVSPKPLPASLLTEVERAVLGGMVESVLMDLIDSIGPAPFAGMKDQQIMYFLPTYLHLFTALNSDNPKKRDSYLAELALKCARIQLDVSSNRPFQWIPLDQYFQRTAVTYYDALKLDHTDSMERMNQLNRTSWYMQPEKLLAYAQQFVRGQLSESNSMRKLRELGIQPLQFYISKIGSAASFDLTDYTGRTYHLVSSTSWQWHIRSLVDGSSIRSSHTGGFGVPATHTNKMFRDEFQFVLTPSEQLLREQWNQFTQGLITIEGMIQEEEVKSANNSWFDSSISQPLTNLSSSPITSSSPLATSSNFGLGSMSSPSPQPSFVTPNPTLTFPIGSLINQALSQSDQIIKLLQQQRKDQKLERLFSQIEPLARFSLFGPTFYRENHPHQIRILFHSHVMDTALIDSGMQPLPRVLNDLISEYACIDLPFIEAEAHQQMSSYSPYFQLAPPSYNQSQNGFGFGLGSQFGPSVPKVVKPPAAGSYPGRTNNPLETIPKSIRRCGGYTWNSTTNTMVLITASTSTHPDPTVEAGMDLKHWV